ncbi:MAG: hypothetical protein KDA61_15320, partial [Planctomycetales bacterium]|nr:hypothetical protein [Planctomycetales bacterium]
MLVPRLRHFARISQLARMLSIVAAVACSATIQAAPQRGALPWKSAGPLAFGPEGILFVGDAKGATIFAIDTEDVAGDREKTSLSLERVGVKIASLLGVEAEQTLIHDMAVNPSTGSAYFSVSRGRGPDAQPALIRLTPGGKLELVDVENVAFSQASLPDAPEDRQSGEGPRRRN